MNRALRLLIVVALAGLMTAGYYSAAFGYSSYLTTFNSKYSKNFDCGVCHQNPAGGGSRNAYGTAFQNVSTHSSNPSGAMDTIASQASPCSGYTYLQMINLNLYPAGDGTVVVCPTATPTPTPTPSPTQDTTAPTVTSFTMPSTSSSLTVAVTSLSATDNVGVTGYLLTQSSTKPSSGASGWSATAPTSYTFSTSGTQTLYAYAKDAAGNVSAGVGATVAITLSSGGGGSTGGSGSISGVVKDIVTGTAISGAVVSDGAHSATTNSSGAYSLSEPAGNYTLTISKSGYLTTSQVATASSSAATTVNWSLTKSYGKQSIPAANMNYVVLAWNDLGMHCDQDDYSYFAVLPPFNTLHAQVFRRGGDSSLVRSGITVSYAFPKKTDSSLHTNFWKYAAQFGWNVPKNVGITGTPLAGNMSLDANGLGYEAVGIPITPYDDDGTWDPYGTAVITVKDSNGQVLQTTNVVAPVSTEMMCSNCHGTTNPQLDILQKHDAFNGTTLAADQARGVVHVCGECHQANALGMPGKPGIPSLSLAMHDFHKDKMGTTPASLNTSPDCYNCHPGQKTQCLRGVMARAGKSCHDCHGDMYAMAESLQNGRQPWVEEPKCGNCHDAGHAENDNTLYRNSVLKNGPTSDMNNRIYCEACHNGPHSIWTTSNPADAAIPQKYQGDNYWIWNCTVCHTSMTQQNMHRPVSSTTTGSYTITASAGSGGSISPSGSVSVSSGGSQSFTITASSGYAISSVLVDGVSVGAVGSYTFSSVTSNHTISASFTSQTSKNYTITASAGSGGSISPSGTVYVSSGGNQSFTITPASGYTIYRVTVDGVSVGAVGSYTFSNVTSNHTISASFTQTPTTYTITASAGSGGSISPSGSVSVASGSSKTFTITASRGYRIYRVVVDGSSVGAVSSYTFSNVTRNHTISASFTSNRNNNH